MEGSTNGENSETTSPTETEQPRRIRLRDLQLLSSKPSELIKNGAEVSRILHQCNAQAPDNAPWMDAIVPLSADDSVQYVDLFFVYLLFSQRCIVSKTPIYVVLLYYVN